MATPGSVSWPAKFTQIEDGAGAAAFFAMAVLPVLDLVLRLLFNTGIPGSFGYVQQLTLWVAFLGAMIAAREKRHIVRSTGFHRLAARLRGAGDVLVAMISSAGAGGVCWGAGGVVRCETGAGGRA